jgi:hypothetical protein
MLGWVEVSSCLCHHGCSAAGKVRLVDWFAQIANGEVPGNAGP